MGHLLVSNPHHDEYRSSPSPPPATFVFLFYFIFMVSPPPPPPFSCFFFFFLRARVYRGGLAVWVATGASTLTEKYLAMVLPVSAFVAFGAEHSVSFFFFRFHGDGVGLTLKKEQIV